MLSSGGGIFVPLFFNNFSDGPFSLIQNLDGPPHAVKARLSERQKKVAMKRTN